MCGELWKGVCVEGNKSRRHELLHAAIRDFMLRSLSSAKFSVNVGARSLWRIYLKGTAYQKYYTIGDLLRLTSWTHQSLLVRTIMGKEPF